MWDVSEVRINAGFGTQIVLFTAKKKFIVAKTIAEKAVAEKAVTANIIPQSRIYSKKILEYLSKNHYTTVLNLFLRTDRFLQIFNFSIPSCTSWTTNSSSNVSTSCHSSNQPFQMANFDCSSGHREKVAQNRIYYPSSEKSHKKFSLYTCVAPMGTLWVSVAPTNPTIFGKIPQIYAT